MDDQEAAEARRIGAEIARLRDAQDWTQQDLANELGLAVSTISRWERGLSLPYPGNRRALAKALGVTSGIFRPREPDAETQLDRIEARLIALEAGDRSASPPAADDGAPQPPGELGRRATGFPPTDRDRKRSGTAREADRPRGSGE